MKLIGKMVLCVMLPLLMFNIQPTHAEAPTQPFIPKPLTITELIKMFSEKYQIDGDLFLKVAVCESKLNPKAIHINDGGKGKHSVGVFQFQQSTFETWEDRLGEDLDYYSYYDQIKLASFMWSQHQQGQWSCLKIVRGI